MLALFLSVVSVQSVAASTGGPSVCEVLGWDASAWRVYVGFVHLDESGSPENVFYFDLRAPRPAAAVELKLDANRPPNPSEDPAIRSLKTRLTPLTSRQPLESIIEAETTPVAHDSVASDVGPRPRYRCDVAPRGDQYLHVLTLDPGRHAVRRVGEYAIPGERAMLVILSTESLALEGGYEVQFPVLMGAGPGTPDPLDPMVFCVWH